ncbi:MAG: chromosome segregation protein SMC [Candidatus Binataceae bacterium]|jgi:chromosome segregation protein
MRLKSLEIVGFKSFLEPTTISFDPGITAVVGPNGCGKSNVVDAIRWLLGEQAPSRLRGKLTEDLIYAGNDSNPAAGMAQVSLVLESEEERPIPEPYAALSEVEVTRRVYRSGESEYLINKIACRLKDITEFFMAAQIHSRGYAIIEQGKIEEIIQAKPAELRSLIEEAAGLALFKGRREISERKLERVKENLARLDDVLSEIDRQLAFARRQAKKAEAYKSIKLELGELERLAAARRLLAQYAELETHSSKSAELESEAGAERLRHDDLRGAVDSAQTALQADRERETAASRELDNVKAGAAERARTRAFIARRLAALDDLEPSLAARTQELTAKATAARAARAELGARLARETNTDSESVPALDASRRRHEEAMRVLEAVEQGAEQIKDQLTEALREAAVIRGRLGDLAGERAELEERLAQARAGCPQLEAAAELAQNEMAAAQADLEASRAQADACEKARATAAESELEARASGGRYDEQLRAARQALAIAIKRAAPITVNGAGDRLRVVLESLNGDSPATPPPFLLDAIKAPAALAPALRAVLGEQMQAVIVDSPQFAVKAVEILKQRRGGRLSFVPESMDALEHHAIAAPGIAGRLIDMLGIEPRFRAVADAMIGHVMLADDLRSALAAADLNGHGTVFVTREGDVVWPGRIVSGGSIQEPGEITEAEPALSVEDAQESLMRAEAERRALDARLEQARNARVHAESELSGARRQAAAAEGVLGNKRTVLARVQQQLALAEANRDGAERRLAELEGMVPAANARLENLAIVERDLRARLAEVKGEFALKKADAEKIGAEMLELAARVESRKARLGALARELAQAAQLAREIESQIGENHATLERSAVERSEFQREMAQLADQDQAASLREAELEAQLQSLRPLCNSRAAELEGLRQSLKAAAEKLAALEHEIVQCGLRRERARALSEELEHNFAEKFQSAFDAMRAELEQALAGRDYERDDNRLAELRAKAERIGEVNLAAESEVKELEERAAALNAQRADLQAALTDLTHTIQKLNREARKRFAETFEGAAKHFAEIFPKLMRGGKARLELTEPDDLLESGVNILVQPAGKKVKDLALLSGGEKALSAIGLVFSLFLLNPSPFCMLDEVDAPLDEFSLTAFTSLMAELKSRSQFIVITHNQRTMQAADQLHGVTMEQPGISRIISIEIPQAA